MKRKIIPISAVLVLLVVTYMVGQRNGIKAESEQQSKRDLQLHHQLVELDESFLTSVVTRPNVISSGTYTLETRFAGQSVKTSTVKLTFSDGQLMKLENLPTQGIQQTGNVVSWEQFDPDEGPSARFVGIIDGYVMWGRIYMKPGQGWREGTPPAYGVWRLYPQAPK